MKLSRLVICAASFGLVVELHAQSAPDTSTSTSSAAIAAGKDDAIELSPFEVASKPNRGYVSSESMTGTRVATLIKDLPFNVNVLTSEFFDDFALFELNENLAYISSFNGLDQGGGYNLRGFNQSYQLRDGFFRLGRYGVSNVDRVEVIKGPNASIYGQTQPGGEINMISKSPKWTQSEKASLSVGSYGTDRATVEATGPFSSNRNSFLGKTAYIAVLGTYERTYDKAFSALRNKEAFGAITHKFSDSTQLTLQAEYFLRYQHAPINPMPYYFDPNYSDPTTINPTTKKTVGRFTGIAYDLNRLSQTGPNAYQNRGYNAVTAIFETRFNEVWSFRSGLNAGHAHNWNFNNVNNQTFNIVTQSIAKGAPSMGLIDEVPVNVQADLLAHYFLFNRKVENRDLFTFDVADYYRFDPTRSLAPGLTYGSTSIVLGQPVDYSVPPFNITNYVNGYGTPGVTTGRWRHNRATDWGDLYRHESKFFDGRLLTYFGARYDEVKLRMRNYIGVPADQPVTYKENLQRWSPNGGVLYKITPNISAYGNYSTGYNPQVQNQDAKNPLVAETDWGYDYGFKTSFFEDKMTLTVGGYYISRKNVTVTELDAQGNQISLPDGDQLVRGQEVELNYSPTGDITIGGSYGHVDSRVTGDGFRFMSIGRPPARIPSDNLGAYGKYNFSSGFLHGLSVNLGVIWTGPFHPESQNAGDTYTVIKDATGKVTSVAYTTNYQWALTAAGSVVWNGGIHYRFKTTSPRFDHMVGVNLNNIFDRRYLTTVRTVGDSRSIFFSYSIAR